MKSTTKHITIKFSAKDDRRIQNWSEEMDLTPGEMIHGMICAALDAIENTDKMFTLARAKRVSRRRGIKEHNSTKARAAKATRAK